MLQASLLLIISLCVLPFRTFELTSLGPLNSVVVNATPEALSASNVVLKDDRNILLQNFTYKGGDAPDAWFFAFTELPTRLAEGYQIPDEDGSTSGIRDTVNDTVTLTLPKGKNMSELVAFGIVSAREKVIYAVTEFDNTEVGAQGNCIKLDPDVRLSWTISEEGDSVEYTIEAEMSENQWLGFGVSKDQRRGSMIGSDVTIISYWKGKVRADDYILEDKIACERTFGGEYFGVCPDDLVEGKNDVTILDDSYENGVLTVTYERPTKTSDPKDVEIRTNEEQIFVFARGDLNQSTGRPNKHTVYPSILKLNLGNQISNDCNVSSDELASSSNSSTDAWDEQVIRNETVFYVVIGPPANPKGVEGITEGPSANVAFYINGLIIPHLYVTRGTTYTFEIRTGFKYPFYITGSDSGGYEEKSPAEQRSERPTIEAGLDNKVVGSLCQYESEGTGPLPDTYQEYAETLSPLRCEPGVTGILKWTPGFSTPDELYYQSMNQEFMGWLITVESANPDDNDESSRADSWGFANLVIAFMMFSIYVL